MNKKEKNLLFLLLACSILFVGILYSPIGSPDSYVQTSYYLQNQGVNFSGKIQNASKMSNLSVSKSSPSFKTQNNFSGDNSFSSSPTISLENKSIEVAEPEYNSDKKNAPKYAVSNASKYTNSSSSITTTT